VTRSVPRKVVTLFQSVSNAFEHELPYSALGTSAHCLSFVMMGRSEHSSTVEYERNPEVLFQSIL